MDYEIRRTSDCRLIERHTRREDAEHALEVLNAHEERNGRGKNYYYLVDDPAARAPQKEG